VKRNILRNKINDITWGKSSSWPWVPFDKLRASLESVYEEALAHEFDRRSIPYERQAKLSVHYKEIVAGEFRTDFPSTALRLRSGCSSGQD